MFSKSVFVAVVAAVVGVDCSTIIIPEGERSPHLADHTPPTDGPQPHVERPQLVPQRGFGSLPVGGDDSQTRDAVGSMPGPDLPRGLRRGGVSTADSARIASQAGGPPPDRLVRFAQELAELPSVGHRGEVSPRIYDDDLDSLVSVTGPNDLQPDGAEPQYRSVTSLASLSDYNQPNSPQTQNNPNDQQQANESSPTLQVQALNPSQAAPRPTATGGIAADPAVDFSKLVFSDPSKVDAQVMEKAQGLNHRAKELEKRHGDTKCEMRKMLMGEVERRSRYFTVEYSARGIIGQSVDFERFKIAVVEFDSALGVIETLDGHESTIAGLETQRLVIGLSLGLGLPLVFGVVLTALIKTGVLSRRA